MHHRLVTLDLPTRRRPKRALGPLFGGHEEDPRGRYERGTQKTIRLLSCFFLVGGDCAWVDRDGEDAVGCGRRDEFADGEFFSVEDAKGREESERISMREQEDASLTERGAGLTSSTWTSRSYTPSRSRSDQPVKPSFPTTPRKRDFGLTCHSLRYPSDTPQSFQT